ncbi:hypothetical protein [Ferrimonas pelagia]|uniref:hypothetical protein n=1 Tax=Ferrimonas pelagia TaxID=1177826 RepID=UPI0031EFDA46
MIEFVLLAILATLLGVVVIAWSRNVQGAAMLTWLACVSAGLLLVAPQQQLIATGLILIALSGWASLAPLAPAKDTRAKRQPAQPVPRQAYSPNEILPEGDGAKTCPECRESVSKFCKQCIHCGHKFSVAA